MGNGSGGCRRDGSIGVVRRGRGAGRTLEAEEIRLRGQAFCGVNDYGQKMGCDVKATCDEPGCNAEIRRDLTHVCGRMHADSDTCHKYYCPKHLFVADVSPGGGLCNRCLNEWEKQGRLEDG